MNASAGKVLLALAIGGAGGYLFSLLRLPLPWMLGPMAFCTVAALFRVPIAPPARIRPYMVMVLGIMLGSGFTPAMLDRVGEWLASLALLLVYIAVTAALALPYFLKVARFDPVTAYFCAMPGGFNEMVMAGTELGGDERRIALIHASRVLLVVFAVPLWLQLSGDLAVINRSALGVGLADATAGGLLLLAACGAVGWPIASKLGLPAAALVGPMLASAALHLTGVTASQPPREIVNLAQLFIGTTVGCRFIGTGTREVLHALAAGTGMTAIMLSVSAGFGLLVAKLAGVPFPVAILAFAPGGLAEMALVGLALGVDTAFIATHHIARIFLVITLALPAFRLLLRRRRRP